MFQLNGGVPYPGWRMRPAARVMRGRRYGKQVHYGVADEHIARVFLDMLDHVVEPAGDDVS